MDEDGGVTVEHKLSWRCPACGQENLSDLVPVDASPEERAVIFEQHGMMETEETKSRPVGFMEPDSVCCGSCEQEHQVVGHMVAGITLPRFTRGEGK